MKRLLVFAVMVIAITLSGPAASALPECYYARVPVPDGGERMLVFVCPMP